MAAQVQKKGVIVSGKAQRKTGLLNMKENQLPSIMKTELGELRESDFYVDASNLSEMSSVGRKVRYQNTYKSAPDDRFPVKNVEKIICSVLEETLSKEKYNLNNCREQIKNVSQVIKDKVKELKIPRYKLVVVVHVGENQGQDVKIASQCLWSAEFDRSATASLQSPYLFAQGTVFGIYFE